MSRKNTYTYALYETRSDGRWYLVGRERETEPLYAVESFYGKLATPRTGDAYRLADGRSVRALLEVNEEDEQLDPYAGMSGRVRLPEHHSISTPGFRGTERENPSQRLPDDVLVPVQHRATSRDRLAAKVELARVGLGVNPGDVPVGATALTVGAPGGYDPDRPRDASESAIVRCRMTPRDEQDGYQFQPHHSGSFTREETRTVDYTERPAGAVIPRELPSLVRQVALARARRIARRDA